MAKPNPGIRPGNHDERLFFCVHGYPVKSLSVRAAGEACLAPTSVRAAIVTCRVDVTKQGCFKFCEPDFLVWLFEGHDAVFGPGFAGEQGFVGVEFEGVAEKVRRHAEQAGTYGVQSAGGRDV